MTKVLMVVFVTIMMTGLVSAQETLCPCDEKQEVKVVKGARGLAGPAGPQGLQGIPGQVPEWYLYLGITGVFFGLLGTGLALGALVARPTPPAVQPVNVINIPGPGGNQNHH